MVFHVIASSFTASSAPLLIFPIIEKLSHNNHLMWKLQVLSTLGGA
jgi:hypothetical protein